jgi:hypothetical protein
MSPRHPQTPPMLAGPSQPLELRRRPRSRPHWPPPCPASPAYKRTPASTLRLTPHPSPSQTSSPGFPLHRSSSPATPSPQTTATATSVSRRSRSPLELPLGPGRRGEARRSFLPRSVKLLFPCVDPRRRPLPSGHGEFLCNARTRKTPLVPVRFMFFAHSEPSWAGLVTLQRAAHFQSIRKKI